MKPLSMFVARLVFCVSAGAAVLSASFSAHAADPNFARTRYPIVLVHGLLGFSDIVGIDYFFRIPDDLRANGATVLVAAVSAVNSPDVRGEQLLKQLKQWSAAGGYQKFNLVGHSLGGPTARYVAGVAPGLVASVTTVGSPHDLSGGGGTASPLNFVINSEALAEFLGSTVGFVSGHPELPQDQQALQAWAQDTPAFNARFPAGQPTAFCGQGAEVVNGIFFYSVTGNKPKTNILDLSDALLVAERGFPGDGLVPVCAAHWGKVLRDDFPWNHLDEVNQLFGLRGLLAPDPVAFYRAQANRLKTKGL